MPVEPQKQPLLSHLQPPQYDPSRQAMQRGGKTFRNPPRRPKWVIQWVFRSTFPTTAIRLPSLISIFMFLKELMAHCASPSLIGHLRTGTVCLLPQQNEAFFSVMGEGRESLGKRVLQSKFGLGWILDVCRSCKVSQTEGGEKVKAVPALSILSL